MIALAKSYAPLVIYIAGIIVVLMSISGRVEKGLSVLIFILPLRNVIDKLHAFPMGKDYVDILIIALIFGWLASAMTRGRRLMEPHPLNAMCFVIIGYMFLSLLVGNGYLKQFVFDPSDPRLFSWKNFALLPLIFLISFNAIHEKKDIWRLLSIMCVTLVFMNLYQVRQIAWYSHIESRIKITGTFVHLGPNEIAAFYNMYSMIMMGVFFHMKNSWKRLAMAGLILVNVYCVLFLFSRAAYIGLAVGCFFMFALKSRFLLILMIVAGLAWQVALPEKVRERIHQTTDEYGELDDSNANRLVVWRESIEIFKSNPIFGAGFGVFRNLGFVLGDTHNIYLKILAEQGIVGFLIFLIFIFLFFTQGLQLYNRGEDDLSKGLGLGLAIAVIVLLVNNIFGDRWTYLQLSGYLWVIAGFVCRLNILSNKTYFEKVNKEKAARNKRLYAHG